MTDGAHFQRVAKLFETARDLPENERAEYLREQCVDAPDVFDEVVRLLGHHDDDAGALTDTVIESGSIERLAIKAAQELDRLPERIGRYTVRRKIGTGGMGAVYLAEQESPRREVAVKVIRPGSLSRELLKRFELEASMLGRLQHPGIAQIYEAGMFDDGSGGQPYFAMELIHGPPLLEFVRQHKLDSRALLELFARVCDAAQHAHLRGVIHRDLKPGNILVDDSGQPKILDFGVARATDSDIQVTTIQTNAAQLIGTLPYMSPEQVIGRAHDIDVRADVYALGVILYELLTGRLPYDLENVTVVTAASVIADVEPTPLSTISRVYRGDLNTIVLKALEKDPERRYASASDLAADVHRYLENQPIVARPATTMYQLRKFARRNKTVVAAAAVLAVVIVAAAAISIVYGIRADRSARLAQWQAYLANIGGADSALMLNDAETAEQRLLNAPMAERSSWEWRHLHSQLDDSAFRFGIDHTPRMAVTFTPDGRTLVTGSRNGQVLVWDLETRSLVRTIGEESSGAIGQRVTLSPDGTQALATRLGGGARIWSIETGEESLILSRAPENYSSADWHGNTIAIGFSNGQVWFWDTSTGQIKRGLQVDHDERSVRELQFSADGSRFAVATNSLSIWDTELGLEIARSPDFSAIDEIDWHPDGSTIATGSIDGIVRIWDANTAAELHTLRGHQGRVIAVRFSPDGTVLATGGVDRTIRLWDTNSGTERAKLLGHRFEVADIAWNPTNQLLASVTTSLDDILLWYAEMASDPTVLPLSNPLWLASSPDGSSVLAGGSSRSGEATVMNIATGQPVAVLPGHAGNIWGADWSANGQYIATGDSQGEVRLWNASDFSLRSLIVKIGLIVNSVAFSRDSSKLAVGTAGPDVLMIDTATNEVDQTFSGHEHTVTRVAFTPDDRYLVAGMWYGDIRVWNVATGKVHAAIHENDTHVMAMAISPDGVIVSAHYDNDLQFTDPHTGSTARTPITLAEFATSLAFHPNGRRLFVGSSAGIVRIFDWPSMDQILVLRGHGAPVNSITATANQIITTDGQVTRVWDVQSAAQRITEQLTIDQQNPESDQ